MKTARTSTLLALALALAATLAVLFVVEAESSDAISTTRPAAVPRADATASAPELPPTERVAAQAPVASDTPIQTARDNAPGISGRVTDPRSQPVAAVVSLWSLHGDEVATTEADSTGEFAFVGEFGVVAAVEASHPTHGRARLELSPPPDLWATIQGRADEFPNSTAVDLRLVLRPVETVRVRTVWSDGRPCAAARVELRPPDGQDREHRLAPILWSKPSDGEGWATFAGVPADRAWQIFVAPPGLPDWTSDLVGPGEFGDARIVEVPVPATLDVRVSGAPAWMLTGGPLVFVETGNPPRPADARQEQALEGLLHFADLRPRAWTTVGVRLPNVAVFEIAKGIVLAPGENELMLDLASVQRPAPQPDSAPTSGTPWMAYWSVVDEERNVLHFRDLEDAGISAADIRLDWSTHLGTKGSVSIWEWGLTGDPLEGHVSPYGSGSAELTLGLADRTWRRSLRPEAEVTLVVPLADLHSERGVMTFVGRDPYGSHVAIRSVEVRGITNTERARAFLGMYGQLPRFLGPAGRYEFVAEVPAHPAVHGEFSIESVGATSELEIVFPFPGAITGSVPPELLGRQSQVSFEPDPPREFDDSSPRQVRVSPLGEFTLANLPPGEGVLLLSTTAQDDSIATSAKRVTIPAGDVLRVDFPTGLFPREPGRLAILDLGRAEESVVTLHDESGALLYRGALSSGTHLHLPAAAHSARAWVDELDDRSQPVSISALPLDQRGNKILTFEELR